ncbi:hypothetical protein C5S30_07200 [ANME-1 cluster archaeon GoMg4]|nr:hypothetical protein [ANME-1 cluster archaeon GoMg4]
MMEMKNSLNPVKYKKLEQKKKFDKERFLKEYDLENLSLSDVQGLLNEELNKEQLLLIAEKRFGIPRGSNLRRTKEQILELIESAINHTESLRAIKEKASE